MKLEQRVTLMGHQINGWDGKVDQLGLEQALAHKGDYTRMRSLTLFLFFSSPSLLNQIASKLDYGFHGTGTWKDH